MKLVEAEKATDSHLLLFAASDSRSSLVALLKVQTYRSAKRMVLKAFDGEKAQPSECIECCDRANEGSEFSTKLYSAILEWGWSARKSVERIAHDCFSTKPPPKICHQNSGHFCHQTFTDTSMLKTLVTFPRCNGTPCVPEQSWRYFDF